jgi:acyl-CoA thioesterase-1
MKYILSAIAVALVLFTLTRKDHTIQPLETSHTILAFGDSLTYGYNADPAQSYPTTLSKVTGLNVINAGIPGDTSGEGLRRLPKYLEDPSVKLLILCMGGNDMIQQIPTETLKTNLKHMIQLAKAKKIDVLLISVPRLTPFGLSPLNLYEEVADEEDIPLLSGLLSDILSQPLLKSDQIHPNGAGYKLMGKEIAQKLDDIGWVTP